LKFKFKNFGPGALVTAAFIGPGTVTTCINAGFNSGFSLMWALIFAIIATITLQEMVLRITLHSGNSVDQELANLFENKVWSIVLKGFIFLAIIGGNSAYQAGNLTGAVIGVEILDIVSADFRNYILIIIFFIALFLVLQKNQKSIKNTLGALVIVMSLAFIFALLSSQVDVIALLKGLFIPTIEHKEEWFTVMSLVGTTVVPYNIFLYSFMVRDHFAGKQDLMKARKDLYINVILGGLISLCIVAVAAGVEGQKLANITDLAAALEPTYGVWSKWMLGFGFFAAGLTSAVTAPLAAGLVAQSVISDKFKYKFEIIAILVLCIGFYFAYMSTKPVSLIISAQYFNGLLLPLCTLLLVYMSFRKLFETYKINNFMGIMAIFVLLVTLVLGVKSLI
jgi:Mn2+/Fe2+ NRAMP family transporter